MLPGGSVFATIAFPEDQSIENLPLWIGENLRAHCRDYEKRWSQMFIELCYMLAQIIKEG